MVNLLSLLELVHEVLFFSVHVSGVWLHTEETIPNCWEGGVDLSDGKEVSSEGCASLVLLEKHLEGVSNLSALELNLLKRLLIIHLCRSAHNI